MKTIIIRTVIHYRLLLIDLFILAIDLSVDISTIKVCRIVRKVFRNWRVIGRSVMSIAKLIKKGVKKPVKVLCLSLIIDFKAIH